MCPKKIAIVLPDLSGGGAERQRVRLANHWVTRGYTVEFVLMRRRGEWLPLLLPEVTIVSLEVDRIRQVILPLRKYLRHARPDVILVAMWPLTSIAVIAWLLSGKLGRLYLSDHIQLSVSCIKELKISLNVMKATIRCTYPFASGIIAISNGVKDDLCRLGGLRKDQIRVIYNPAAVGATPIRESEVSREALWGSGYKHHILAVGTLKEQKDFTTLIMAFSSLPRSLNAKLVILGEGSLRPRLKGLIAQLDLSRRIVMPGFIFDPSPWYRSADLFVLASQWEGFANVIVEALECGVPVVSTNCPSGPAEILENGRFGKLVPIGDKEAMAAAITESLNEVHDHGQLIARAKIFSVGEISAQYLGLFFTTYE